MHNIIKKVLEISNGNVSDFEELFHEDFHEVLDQYQIITLDPGTRFVGIDESISIVWILLLGKVKGLEEYSTGDIFTFKRFSAPEVFGEMETLADIEKFRATLITETECVFLTIPVDIYKKFLENNSKYLYKRTNIIINRVLDEKKHLRMLLMMNSTDRVKEYLLQYYKIYSENDKCILKITRQQIAEEIGYSVKTVNRVIKKLEKEDLLKIEGQRLVITELQYKKMHKSVEKLVN